MEQYVVCKFQKTTLNLCLNFSGKSEFLVKPFFMHSVKQAILQRSEALKNCISRPKRLKFRFFGIKKLGFRGPLTAKVTCIYLLINATKFS